MFSIKTSSEAETAALARQIAPLLRIGDCLAFQATLGMGKSVFCRHLIQNLSPETQDVPSPTFTLVQQYPHPNMEITHVDLYRIDDVNALEELGLDEALQQGICLIEWSERMQQLLPRHAIIIRITKGLQEDERLFSFDIPPALQGRFAPFKQFILENVQKNP